MSINYTHHENIHSIDGASKCFDHLFSTKLPESIIDVGCGAGFWLAAARSRGVKKILGIDGILVENPEVPKELIKQVELSSEQSWEIHEKYEIAICLEVAEHLSKDTGSNLIRKLSNIADTIIFSAAIPDQPGQHHVNCQWPLYWQNEFNKNGFYCDDSVRWEIWDHADIEVWYRQNIFIARKDSKRAGHEARILSVIHPDILRFTTVNTCIEQSKRGEVGIGNSLHILRNTLIEKFKKFSS